MANGPFRATRAIHLSAANDSNGWSIPAIRRFVNERLHGAHSCYSVEQRSSLKADIPSVDFPNRNG
jgi:hypothetical protein